jgi:MraZ protein
MFTGEHEHTIDDKSRVTLPSRFRGALQEGVVLARGFDGQVDVYPRSVWGAVVQARLAELDPFSREGRDVRRFLFAGASEDEPDKQGRVHVPAALVRHAGLGKEVVVAGLDDHLELWSRERWAERVNVMEGSADDVAERLADKRS